jgi:hypothetical protein
VHSAVMMTASPKVVAQKTIDNFSNEPITNTITVSHRTTKSDRTRWERAWGFELEAGFQSSFSIPFLKSIVDLSFGVSVNAAFSYNTRKGTETVETKAEEFGDTQTLTCPPFSRCFFNLIGRHLDNVAVPFIATVQRNMEVWAHLIFSLKYIKGTVSRDFDFRFSS